MSFGTRRISEATLLDRLVRYCAFHLTDENREHRQYGYLTGERFGRSHADFRSHVDVASRMRRARNRRAYHVADAEYECSLRLGEFERGERIGGLARLRQCDEYVLVGYDRIAVAEFARILDLHRNAAEILY